jgi:hypothetical protein
MCKIKLENAESVDDIINAFNILKDHNISQGPQNSKIAKSVKPYDLEAWRNLP